MSDLRLKAGLNLDLMIELNKIREIKYFFIVLTPFRYMKYNFERKEIDLEKELNNLDKFVRDFCILLEEYVIVSGYVSILFGRSRATEDIDLLVPKLNKGEFRKVWERAHENKFECINTSSYDKAFEMLKEHAIRFSKLNNPVPNIEFKIIKNDNDEYSLKNKLRVKIEGGNLFISPIEMQIAYKLGLGSDKDLEDAKHLYEVFKEKINKEELDKLVNELEVKSKFELIKEYHGTKFKKTK